MSYKIVADSCCEFPSEYENDSKYERIPLGLEVENELIMDDASFDQAQFLKKVAASPNVLNLSARLRKNLRKPMRQRLKMCLYLLYLLN